MAFKKILSMRLFNVSKFSSPNSLQNSRISTPSTAFKSLATVNTTTVNNENGVNDNTATEDGIFRRFLHARASHAPPVSACSFPKGENLLKKLRGLDVVKERINLDGLKPPAISTAPAEEAVETAEVRKLLRFSELENVKSKLREIERSCIGYEEFVELCCTTSFGKDEGVEMAKLLDQSGVVIVLGDVVFIRPHQIMKAIQGLMPESVADSRMKVELEQMEREKAVIDRNAKALVRRELGFGLGYLAIQTAVVMRLTFWELTWDVMEPICFYLTSMYFMAGYAFFLRTSKEPSFEGFYQSRFSTKQKRLMKLENFDLERYNQLLRACYPDRFPVKENSMSLMSKFGDFSVPAMR